MLPPKDLYMSAGDQNLDTYACIASALTTKLSPSLGNLVSWSSFLSLPQFTMTANSLALGNFALDKQFRSIAKVRKYKQKE